MNQIIDVLENTVLKAASLPCYFQLRGNSLLVGGTSNLFAYGLPASTGRSSIEGDLVLIKDWGTGELLQTVDVRNNPHVLVVSSDTALYDNNTLVICSSSSNVTLPETPTKAVYIIIPESGVVINLSAAGRLINGLVSLSISKAVLLRFRENLNNWVTLEDIT